MLNVRLAGDHLFGKLLFNWLSLVMSVMVSFCAVLFPTRCLGWDFELNWVNFWGFSFLLFHTKIQPKMSSGSGEKADFVIFAIFSNGGHLEYSTWPNFIILRPWCQVMLHVKFENCRCNSFIDKDVWIFGFKCWRTNAWRTTDYYSAKNNRSVTSKKYALLHIIVLLSAKFQFRWIETVGNEHAKNLI